MGEPVSVTCAQCKAPYAVYGVEPPLEYVCAACTGNAAPLRAICTHCGNVWEPKKPWHADELRSWPKAAVCGDCGYWALVSPPKDKPGPSLFAITTEQWRKQARPQG